jgi:hypothetical protein
MIPLLEASLSGPASVGVGKVAGSPMAAVVEAKGSRPSGRQDESLLQPDADTPAEQPEGGDSEPNSEPDSAPRGNRAAGHQGAKSDEVPAPVAPGKDAGPGGVPFIADQIPPDRPDDPISGPQLRKRAARAYSHGIKVVTRNPLALGVVFDNNS